MSASIRMVGAALVLFAALAGCGGGGGGGDAPLDTGKPIQPPPTSSESILPSGARIDVSAQNLFPLGLQDTWTYRVYDAANKETGTLTYTVTEANGDNRTVQETPANTPTFHNYIKTAQGITDALIDPTLPGTMARTIGPVELYVEPLYPVNTTRILRRAGSVGLDLTGDDVAEGFRYEYNQTFRGFESLTIGRKQMQVAHFSNTTRITLTSSNPKDSPITVVLSEESFYRAGFGLVKQISELRDGNGQVVEAASTIELAAATVGGQKWADFIAIEAGARSVAVTHAAAVYDIQNQRYYLSVPAAASLRANSIASVDPVTAAVTYRDLPGLDPGAMAVAGDGKSLYVALNGTLQIARLALPGLQELQRFAVPPRMFNPKTTIGVLAASPTDPDLIAATVQAFNNDVVLFRNGVAQPLEAAQVGGSLVFDFSGSRVFSREFSDQKVHALLIQGNGLARSNSGTVFTGSRVTLAPAGLVIGDRTYSADTLASGSLLKGDNCAAQRSAIFCRVVDFPQSPPPGSSDRTEQMFLLDPVTRNPIGNISIGMPAAPVTTFLQGPKGQLGVSRLRADGSNLANELSLFDSNVFP